MSGSTPALYSGPVIDACIHHRSIDEAELVSYMSAGWRAHIGSPGSLPGGLGAVRVVPGRLFRNPAGDKRADAFPASGLPAGSEYDTLRRQALEPAGIERAILCFDDAMLAPTIPDYYLAREVCRAANDWCIDRWLSGVDDRLYGLVLSPNQVPSDAAAEIRRVGSHPRLVGVMLGGNGAGVSFGHLIYHPIYEACVELGLPVVLHVGADAAPDGRTATAIAGNPTTFTEYSVMSTLPIMTHITSFILHGAFEKYPTLRVLVVGSGAAWLPHLFWRLDVNWAGLRREVPWVREPPSEYLRKHIRLTTWPLDRAPTPAQFALALDAFGGMEDLLCFASGYPDWNWEEATHIAEEIPEAWRANVMYKNAESLFRWSPVQGAPPPDAADLTAR